MSGGSRQPAASCLPRRTRRAQAEGRGGAKEDPASAQRTGKYTPRRSRATGAPLPRPALTSGARSPTSGQALESGIYDDHGLIAAVVRAAVGGWLHPPTEWHVPAKELTSDDLIMLAGRFDGGAP